MALSELLQTDIHLAALLGSREERDDHFVVRTPENPGFFYGNLLVLKDEPKEIERWEQVFEDAFGVELGHCCIAWSGAALDEDLLAEARRRGFDSEGGTEMCMTELPDRRDTEWTTRPLEGAVDWEQLVKLNLECDVTEQASTEEASTDEAYPLFKQRLRATWRMWLERGLATWWAAFDGETMIAQCGMVVCGELGRFQAVETHPDWRRRGVCGALIAQVARDAFERLGCKRLLLTAEIDGPALGLYRSLGFEETGRTHSIVKHMSPRRIRAERKGDHVAVRSLVKAAFGGADESRLIEALRIQEGSISLVAEQTNALLGHVLFSTVRIDGAGSKLPATALAPLAVRPAAQRRGVGTALVEAGIEQAKCAGHVLCLVIGSPDYYARFGFIPASPYGLTNPFDVKDEHFMVLELSEGALESCAGRVIYDAAFDVF